MKKILLLLSVLLPFAGSAQVAYGGPPAASPGGSPGISDPTSLTVQINNPVYFDYTTVDDLLETKIIHNAFQLRVDPSATSNTRVFAQIDFGSKRRSIPENWISLKLVNKSSTIAVADDNNVYLSGYPVLLFTQPPQQGAGHSVFNYDVLLSPLTQHVRPDNYSFTITFTMTQP